MRIALLLSFAAALAAAQSPVDLVWVLDDTASITSTNFEIVREFLRRVTQRLSFNGDPQTSCQMGAVKYSLNGEQLFSMNDYNTQSGVVSAITAIPYGGGIDNVLMHGMMAGLEQFRGTAHGNRPGVDNFMIIITDGHDGSDVASQQREAQRLGVTVYAIGVALPDDPEVWEHLAAATGSPSRVIRVPHWTALLERVNYVVNLLLVNTECQNGGVLHCFCTHAWTGPNCDIPVNMCVDPPGDVLCGEHGTCMYDPNRDPPNYCVCDEGWLPPYCDIPDSNTHYIGTRCEFQYNHPNPSADCENPNDPQLRRCVPNNLDCHNNPCVPPDSSGWCVPAVPPLEEEDREFMHGTLRKRRSASNAIQCENGATAICDCPYTHTGPNCDIPFNWCPGGHGDDGVHGPQQCGPFGDCVYNPETGSSCVCHEGWTGEFCDILIDGYIGRRCYLSYGMGNPSINCTGTTPVTRCIADNQDCAMLPCPFPENIGWCVPLAAGIPMVEEIRQKLPAGAVLVYDDPYNFGPPEGYNKK